MNSRIVSILFLTYSISWAFFSWYLLNCERTSIIEKKKNLYKAYKLPSNKIRVKPYRSINCKISSIISCSFYRYQHKLFWKSNNKSFCKSNFSSYLFFWFLINLSAVYIIDKSKSTIFKSISTWVNEIARVVIFNVSTSLHSLSSVFIILVV